MDLYFADGDTKTKHNCSVCVRNPINQQIRRCQEPGFKNLVKPREIDAQSLKYSFCAGKATWFDDIAILFDQCRVTLETGILPKAGSIEDQSEMFADVLPTFIERWRDRNYSRVWTDVNKFTTSVLEALFSSKKK